MPKKRAKTRGRERGRRALDERLELWPSEPTVGFEVPPGSGQVDVPGPVSEMAKTAAPAASMDARWMNACATALGVSGAQVRRTAELLKDEATVPFIVRYRQEALCADGLLFGAAA